jgi:protein ERP2
MYKEQRKEGDEYIFDPSKGDFQFCFGNQFSTISHKVIFFDISPDDVDRLAVEAGDESPRAQTASESACDNIHFEMSVLIGLSMVINTKYGNITVTLFKLVYNTDQ